MSSGEVVSLHPGVEYFPNKSDSLIAQWLLERFATDEIPHHDGWDFYRPDSGKVWRKLDERDLARALAVAQRDGVMWVDDGKQDQLILNNSRQVGVVKNARKVAAPIAFEDSARGVAFADGQFFEILGNELVQRKLRVDDHIRHALLVPYDPSASCPRFLKFLEEVWGHLPDYEQRVVALQDWLGTLVARESTQYQQAIVLLGDGDNGKSRLFDPLQRMIPSDLVTAHNFADLGDNNFALADLEGAWLNAVPDMSRRDLKDTAALKAAITGDRVTAAKKHKDHRTFHPRAGHLVSCNELPKSHDHTDGVYRRFIVLTFTRQFPQGDPKRDPELHRKLAAEAPGVAVWALEGLRRILRRGCYVEPQSSLEAKLEWRGISDSVAAFVNARLTNNAGAPDALGPAKGTSTKALFREYRTWTAGCGGGDMVPQEKFVGRLRDLGYPATRRRDTDGRQYRVRLWIRDDGPRDEVPF